jgi:hypothetical protein
VLRNHDWDWYIDLSKKGYHRWVNTKNHFLRCLFGTVGWHTWLPRRPNFEDYIALWVLHAQRLIERSDGTASAEVPAITVAAVLSPKLRHDMLPTK